MKLGSFEWRNAALPAIVLAIAASVLPTFASFARWAPNWSFRIPDARRATLTGPALVEPSLPKRCFGRASAPGGSRNGSTGMRS